MSAPGGEGAKSGLSIMEVAGNAVNIQLPAHVLNFAFLRGAKGGWRGRLVLQTERPGRRPRLISKYFYVIFSYWIAEWYYIFI